MHDAIQKAIALWDRHNYDRRGDGQSGAWKCTCEWSADTHGDTCPEHGTQGAAVPNPVADLLKDFLSLTRRSEVWIMAIKYSSGMGNEPLAKIVGDLRDCLAKYTPAGGG